MKVEIPCAALDLIVDIVSRCVMFFSFFLCNDDNFLAGVKIDVYYGNKK
jgi:hypothetical protein